MGTKANPGKYDCLDKAAPDEPFFTLLARDKYMAALVWLWAKLRQEDGDDPAQWQEALLCVSETLGWRSLQGKPIPSLNVDLQRIVSVIAGVDLEQEYQRARSGRAERAVE